MKNYLLFLAFMFFLTANSQSNNNKENAAQKSTKEKLFQRELYSVMSIYRNKVSAPGIIVQDKLLNTRLTKAFNQVVFSSSDLVDNASAFGVSRNEENTTVSVNTNFHLGGEAKDQWFLKAGINSNGSGGSIFNIYSGNEWQNSVGGNIGFIWKFGGSGFSNEDEVKFNYDKVLREIFIRDSIMSEVLELNLNKYVDVRKEYISSLDTAYLVRYEYDKVKDTINRKEIKKNYKKLTRIELLLKKIEKNIPSYKNIDKNNKIEVLNFSNYDSSTNNTNDKIIKYLLTELWKEAGDGKLALRDLINDVAYVYDEKNIKNTGYSFWWLDGNFKLNNNTFNFSEKAENVESEVLEEFKKLNEVERTGLNKLGKEISVNVNYTRNRINFMYYLKGGFKYNSGSFLNSNLINGTAKVSEQHGVGGFFIKDKDNTQLGELSAFNKNLSYGSLDIYGAYFFGKKKVFGLNLALTHRYRIETPEASFYKNNYSVLFSPIFRKPKKDDDTGLTFGIDIGFDNAMYAYNAKDNFVARIRVGIPFNLYTMKK